MSDYGGSSGGYGGSYGSGSVGGFGSSSNSGGDSDNSSQAGGGGYSGYSDPGESATITPSPVQTVASQYAAYGEGRAIAESAAPPAQTSISGSGGLSQDRTFSEIFSSAYSSLGNVGKVATLLGPTPPLAKVQAAYGLYNSIDFNALNIGSDKPRIAWNGDSIGTSTIYSGNSGSPFGSDSGVFGRAVSSAAGISGAASLASIPSYGNASTGVDQDESKVYDQATDSVNETTKETSSWNLSSIIATIAGVASIYGAFKT